MPWYKIDQQLVTIKMFYFLALSALAMLLPYLPVFLTQIGVKSVELGVIYGLISFTTFIKNGLVGYFADKYKFHKTILILSCILTGPLYATLLAVPSVSSQPELKIASRISLRCSNSLIENTTSYQTLRANSHGTPLTCLSPFGEQETVEFCEIFCTTPQHLALASSGTNESQRDSNGPWLGYNLTCLASYACQYSVVPPYTSLTFWMCLAIGLTAALCGSNELMMNDAIALSILGDNRRKWGRSRMWGSAGYGLSAICVSLLIDRLASGEPTTITDIDYTPAFYIYMVLSLSAGVVAYFHPTGQLIKCSQGLQGIGTILHDVRVISFLTLILYLGFCNGIVITYVYLYLKTTLGASQLVMGSCVLVTVIVELPILFIGGKIVDKIGAMSCLYLALVAYSIRFLAYAYIPSPWWATLVETTHMFTFGLMFTAANMYAGQVTSKGYTGTLIGMINGIKWGLGLGLGSLLGSHFADAYADADGNANYNYLFICSGLSCLVVLVIYVIINEVIIRGACAPGALPAEPADSTENGEVICIKLSAAEEDDDYMETDRLKQNCVSRDVSNGVEIRLNRLTDEEINEENSDDQEKLAQ